MMINVKFLNNSALCMRSINLYLCSSVRSFSRNIVNFNSYKVGVPQNPIYNLRTVTTPSAATIHENIAALTMKKRPQRKRRSTDENPDGYYTTTAFATAEEYDLEKLIKGLRKQNLYEAKKFLSSSDFNCSPDVVHAHAKYQVGKEPREIFFFREGSMVLWNISELECSNLLSFIREFEQDSYGSALVEGETETMVYYSAEKGTNAHIKANNFVLSDKEDQEKLIEKYTFSNAMALSVKLGIWEASLDRYIDSIGYVTEDLKRGNKIRMTRDEILRKTGELFALRHMMNLSSDLLDTPDFYWDREQMENLYTQTCSYFSIARRTKVMNEKLNHCVELAELISSHLNDKHHIRLEWMIIVLIMVEVGFEIVHYVDRYVA